jgi:hypothetical protein
VAPLIRPNAVMTVVDAFDDDAIPGRELSGRGGWPNT